ncbi:MAG TPA: hypothetical protein VNO30_31935 [Kofleriaceae bacterium]|nr:hypothetical protein [Kofleriaceae bacterium]
MQRLPFFSYVLITLTAAACTDDSASITISTAREPAAIAFRDGPDGAWQVPTAKAAGSYEIAVHGPYIVSVVCETGDGATVATRQIARTPDDSRELDLACEELPQVSAQVKGEVVQPGAISVGGLFASSDTPDWELDMGLPAGTFDLIGVSDSRIMLRRDLAVSGTVDLQTIDIDAQGAELVPTALTAANAATGETIRALVMVTTPKNELGLVHLGAPASAKVAPAAFVTGDVRQTVTMMGQKDNESRVVRRDFRAGDATSFTLPEPIGPVEFAAQEGQLVATWSTLPEHDKLVVAVTGELADGKARSHELALSQRYLAETGATRATLATDLPGYEAAWKLDLTREHLREAQAVRERDGEQATSGTSKLVSAQPLQAQRARPPALDRLRLAR